MKNEICAAIGIVGGAIASLLGGWDTALQTLIIFMAIDYITGLIVAGVFHTSPKTKTGTLECRTDGCAHPGGADSCCGRAEAAGGRKERQLTAAPGSLMVPRG